MSNLSGWGLASRLIAKHFGVLGDKVSEAIANFDPETATEADRDRLQETLLQTAQKLAQARAAFEHEHAEVVSLRNLIATDEKASATLAERMAAGTISEASVNLFCDELEANKAKLPQELQQEADAQAYLDEVQKLVDAFSKQLADFDAVAKKAKLALASAHAQQDLQQMRTERQNELNGLKTLGGHSTALDALTKEAQRVSAQAAGLKIVADINQQPLDQAAEIDAIRKSVAQPEATSESTLARLQRLTAPAAVAV